MVNLCISIQVAKPSTEYKDLLRCGGCFLKSASGDKMICDLVYHVRDAIHHIYEITSRVWGASAYHW